MKEVSQLAKNETKKMHNLKESIKKLNVSELYFDISIVLLLVVFRLVMPSFLSIDPSSEIFEVVVLALLFLFPMIIFISLGKIMGNFRKHRSGVLLMLLCIISIIIISIAILALLEDIYEQYLEGMLIISPAGFFLASVVLGYSSKTKGFLKAVTIAGVILVIGVLVSIIIFMLGERLFEDSFSLVASSAAFLASILFFIVLPRRFVKWMEKKEAVKRFVNQLFVILSAISFACWYYLSETFLVVTNDLGFTQTSSNYMFFFLAVFLFRLMLAFEPPKNRLNIAIGLIVLVISYFV